MDKEMKTNEKATLLSNIDMLRANSKYEYILFYIKSNALRGPLEIAITIYILLIMLIFTTQHSKCPLPSDIAVRMIFIPLALSAMASFIYTCIVSYIFHNRAFEVVNRNKGSKVCYESIDDEFASFFKTLHIVAALIYMVFAALIAVILVFVIHGDYFTNNAVSIITMTFVGGLFGALWNIYGFHSDQRIDWAKIFPQIIETSILNNEMIRMRKYRAYRKSIMWQIIIAAVVLIAFFYIAVSLKPVLFDNRGDNQILDELIVFSSIPALFIAVLTIYFKQTYRIYYKMKRDSNDDPSEIFPNILELTKEYNEDAAARASADDEYEMN